MAIDEQLVEAARELASQAGKLRFRAPVTHVYNPLIYAWKAHEAYLRRFGGTQKEVVFLGMNPGPFGMAQTGVPFGEISAVRDWMKIQAVIDRPAREHPRRPIQGFACPRSEISGRRLWGLFEQRFGAAENFFARHFVVNYCPLAFLQESGGNHTPDKLPAAERERLARICDAHLRRLLEILRPILPRVAPRLFPQVCPFNLGRYCIPALPAPQQTRTGRAKQPGSCRAWASGNNDSVRRRFLGGGRLPVQGKGNADQAG
jgi:single-strand selective monofunctional uracil DNA glycosylase